MQALSRFAPKSLSYALGEVVILVLGILIAFGLDSWWDARKAIEWEHTQLESLHEEFDANLAHVGRVVRSHEITATGVTRILEFASESPPGATAVFPDSVLALLIAWRTSEMTMGTLDALLASGDLGRLRNADLRKDLAAWKAWVLDAQEKEVLAREFIEFVMTPALLGQEILTPAYAARPPFGSGLPTAPVQVASTPELRDLASARLGHLRLAIHSQLRVKDEASKILALLEEELAGTTSDRSNDDLSSASPATQYNDVLWSGTLDSGDSIDAAVREVFFPAGWVAPRHSHSSDLFLYVMEGEFEVTLEGKSQKVYGPGEALEMRAGTAMEARNFSNTQPLKFVVFQVGQTQAPFVVPIQDPAR
jgi:quercetin dioxygenase-like cupin family protein